MGNASSVGGLHLNRCSSESTALEECEIGARFEMKEGHIETSPRTFLQLSSSLRYGESKMKHRRGSFRELGLIRNRLWSQRGAAYKGGLVSTSILRITCRVTVWTLKNIYIKDLRTLRQRPRTTVWPSLLSFIPISGTPYGWHLETLDLSFVISFLVFRKTRFWVR